MAKKANYDQFVDEIIDLLGGKSNISFFVHCITRLRFNVKDRSLVQVDKIEAFDCVIGTQWSGEQFQIIIGQSVADVYKAICDKHEFDSQKSVDAIEDQVKEKKKFSIAMIFDAIAGCIIPVLPAILGAGMIKVVLLLLVNIGLLSPESGTYALLNMVADAGLYFLPVFVGKAAAKKFGANESLGMLIGAMLLHPTFVSGVAEGKAFEFFGIPVYGALYGNSVLPVIMAVAIMAPIERFIARKSPEIIRSITQPLFTLLIMVPIVFCIIGPAGAFLGQYVASILDYMNGSFGFIALGIMAVINPFIIMTGMHGAVISFGINSFATYGYEALVMPANVMSTFAQGAAALAVGLKTKNKKLKATAISASTTALIGGVTEPAMYAVNLKYKTPMIGAMIGAGISGLIAGILKVTCYVPGGQGIFIIPSFIGGEGMSNVIFLCIAIVLSIIISFIATYILYKDKEGTV